MLTQFLEVSRGEKIIYFQEFFFPMKFWVGNGPKCDFFPKKYRGPRGGPKFFLLSLVALWWNSIHFSPKKFFCSFKNDKVDQMILLWPIEKTAILGAREELFRAKKVRISPLSHWSNQKIFVYPPGPYITNLKKITFSVFYNQKHHWKKNLENIPFSNT